VSLDAVGGPGGAWLIAALLLGTAELAMPGVFLVFVAIAAAITGLLAVALPDLSASAQLASFGAWSVAAVLIGRRWYSDYPVDSDAALLNDRGAQMVGQVVVVEVAIEQGRGRVRVGDGVWSATGPDLATGARARVRAVDNGTLVVEPT
jgi:hypothetical protein